MDLTVVRLFSDPFVFCSKVAIVIGRCRGNGLTLNIVLCKETKNVIHAYCKRINSVGLKFCGLIKNTTKLILMFVGSIFRGLFRSELTWCIPLLVSYWE